MNKWRLIAQILLVILGLLQSTGYILQMPKLRGVAMATTASPLPLVFSHFRGLETFSSSFQVNVVEKTNEGDVSQSIILSPELYSKFPGPYNRRNVYGAVVAYGIKMTEHSEAKLVQDVLTYGFCGDAPLLRSFGFKHLIKNVEILISNTPSGVSGKLSVECLQ